MEVLEHIQARLVPFALDVLRLGVRFFLLMVVFAPLEKLFSQEKVKILRKSFFVDMGYFFLNSLVPSALLGFPAAALARIIHALEPQAMLSFAADLPMWARLVGAMVVGEVGYYWGHRWMHEIPFLWRFHAIHHSAEEMDWLVSSRAHPLDIVFTRLCGFVPMYALGFAQPLAGHVLDPPAVLFLALGAAWGYFIHANVKWRFGWLSFLITTPAFHHWHHTRRDHINKNYATMLPFVDLLFGSWYLPSRQSPAEYGIDGPVEPGLIGQLLQPFAPTMPAAATVPPLEEPAPVESAQNHL